MNDIEFAEAERVAIMSLVRARLYTNDLEDLSLRIGRSVSCLMAIRSGRTKWPHANTLFPLIHLLGLKMTLVKQESVTRLSNRPSTRFVDNMRMGNLN